MIADAMAVTGHMKWIPNSGPQTDAYFCKADVLLYGGQGGGGKSDLGLGLAFTAHKRSLIMRRKYANLSALTERAIAINGSRNGFNGSPPPLLRVDDKYIQFAGNQHAGDEEDWQGHAFDFKYFDEATQFLQSQIRFHLGWLRSTEEGQRVRAVLGTNPPINADGDWIIGMFRPWLDVTHPKPAKHGELRWFVTAPDGSDLELDGPEPIELEGKKLSPMSRTFIPAALKDNPFLINTNYQANLDGLPEPLRSAVRDGNFMAARQDADFQVLPTQWLIEAQGRWKADGYKAFNMTAMAFDPAGGGADSAELARRHGGWYAEMISEKGSETADGSKAAGVIISHRRDSAPVVVDVGGGYGGAVTLRLKDNGIPHVGFNGAGAATGHTIDGQLKFANKRAEAWWRFREALNPDQQGGSVIALPPDPELRSDLAAPTYEVSARGLLIENKDDLRKRLGRSPGKGDACVMALSAGDAAVKRELNKSSLQTTANRGYENMKKRR
ncbi:terminase [Bradyrhizobium sp. 197]|uniref:terminase n=1 Tax=Bradyrhizobium sp. 197 TaxID=2782663 RepID=UPI001FFA5057|nr:terminase [Bradyrhizobium sp. 197]MCK1479317.1 terminase [Bradyrhizobium sp. 197]